MNLAIAGDDVTEFLAVLLGRINFPYKELDLARLHDWALMEDIKCRIATLNEVWVWELSWLFLTLCCAKDRRCVEFV